MADKEFVVDHRERIALLVQNMQTELERGSYVALIASANAVIASALEIQDAQVKVNQSPHLGLR